jgi:hypothetical protein
MFDQVSAPTLTCTHAHPAAHRTRQLQQAESVLRGWFGLSPEEAGAILRAWSIECDACTCQVAEALVNAICLGRGTTQNPELVRRLEQRLRRLPT